MIVPHLVLKRFMALCGGGEAISLLAAAGYSLIMKDYIVIIIVCLLSENMDSVSEGGNKMEFTDNLICFDFLFEFTTEGLGYGLLTQWQNHRNLGIQSHQKAFCSTCQDFYLLTPTFLGTILR